MGPPVRRGGDRVSWEGRGGFRLGFSHSFLSPQAWVFLRCGLGGGYIRAELAEGEVCLACAQGPLRPGKEEGLCSGTTPTPAVQVRVISKGVGSGPGTAWRSKLTRDCPAETAPGHPQSGLGFG